MKISTAVLLALAGLAGCTTQGAGCGGSADGDRWCQSCSTASLVGVRCNNGRKEAFTYCAANDQYCRFLPMNDGGGEYTPVQ